MTIDIILPENNYSYIRQNSKLLAELRNLITFRFITFAKEDVKDAYGNALTKWEEFCFDMQFWDWTRKKVVGWLVITTRNNLINTYRRKKSRRRTEEVYLTFNSESENSNSLQEFRDIFSERFLDRAIKDLTPAKEGVVRAFLRGDTIEEIADAKGILPETVKKYVTQFINHLKSILQNENTCS